jgi:catechol 2,3-dioxygenase-like lactoylglutathione lyase family enzyme
VDDQDLHLNRVGVVMLGVTALARSVPFYRDKLGLKLTGQHEGFAFFDGSGVTLCLSESLARASKQIPGATEVVFSVENVRNAHRALAARGITFTQAPRTVTGPMWAANFQDPDGHNLSVFGPEGTA